MKILFEEYHYAKSITIDNEEFSLSKVLAEAGVNAKHVEKDTKLSIDYVGYFYSQQLKDCVFILPKVLIKEDGTLLNENIRPEELLSIDNKSTSNSQKDKMAKEMLDFVYEFSVWVYRAIDVFRHRNPDSDIAVNPEITQMGRGRRRDRYTLVDIMLALRDFNRKNQDYLTFVIRNIHSGNNKINWSKTIAKNKVIMQDSTPIYISPVNKKKQVNYDEELLIIYYSILHHIHKKYNFPVYLNANFDLITGKRFEQYIKGTGKRRLKQIKYKYFSDKDLKIWDLCYAFFDHAYKVTICNDVRDYLLVHDFHSVFEDMIDELLSDKDENAQKMKVQDDNKRLDHLYRYYGLTKENEQTYYIGDSKYYPLKAAIPESSVAKQYTYARNLVQYDMDLFNSDKPDEKKKAIAYRDEFTEGYDIVPNFFISAQINDISEKGYSDSKIERKILPNGKFFFISCHFKNRLYDRDTILISHYNVNFLFVLALYAKNRSIEQLYWAKDVKEKFRNEIIEGLNKDFQFHVMKAKNNVDAKQYFRTHFQKVLGKVYSPFGNNDIISLALDRDDPENNNASLIKELEQFFIVKECPLGTNTDITISNANSSGSGSSSSKAGIFMVMMENFDQKSKKFLPSGKIAIGLKNSNDSMEIEENLSSIGFVLFHHRSTDGQHLFVVKGFCRVISSNEVESDRYKNINTAERYLAVDIDTTERDSSSFDSTKKQFTKDTRYDAQFAFINDLLLQKEEVIE